MKHKGRLVWAFAAAGLLFLALGALVEHPTQPRQPIESAVPPPVSVLIRAEQAMPGEAAPPTRQADADSQRALPEREQDDHACVTVSDGNGYPLRAETYFREVYAAFPPERLPG